MISSIYPVSTPDSDHQLISRESEIPGPEKGISYKGDTPGTGLKATALDQGSLNLTSNSL